ncbi:MAG: hypothetical protein WCJ26_11790 [bacterium]
MDDKDIEGQEKLQRLWNDAKRYQETHEEVRKAIHESNGMPRLIPFYRQRYFAVAASIVILVGISAILFFFIEKPFSSSGKENLSHGTDTALKLHMEKPEAKASHQIYQDETLLQWTERYDTITHLVILDAPNGKIVFTTEIEPAKQSFQLPKNILKPGKYNWYIGDKKHTRQLIISN